MASSARPIASASSNVVILRPRRDHRSGFWGGLGSSYSTSGLCRRNSAQAQQLQRQGRRAHQVVRQGEQHRYAEYLAQAPDRHALQATVLSLGDVALGRSRTQLVRCGEQLHRNFWRATRPARSTLSDSGRFWKRLSSTAAVTQPANCTSASLWRRVNETTHVYPSLPTREDCSSTGPVRTGLGGQQTKLGRRGARADRQLPGRSRG